MKKFFAKLAIFSIISLMLMSINAMIALAEGLSSQQALDLSNALNDLTWDQYCIQEMTSGGKPEGPDDGYLITIVEEPLSLEQSTTTTANKDEFETRICYRNTISYFYNKEHKTIPMLAKKCANFILTNQQATYTTGNVTASCKPVQVYLSKGGTVMIENYIATIYKWAASMVGVIAVVVIIISGLQISIGGGDTAGIDKAKTRIIKSLVGIAVLFLSGVILYTINPTFFTR